MLALAASSAAIASVANAASTNPWALPQTQGAAPQANLPQSGGQGGFNMGGGFTFGGGNNARQFGQNVPQFIGPQANNPQQIAPQQIAPQQVAPQNNSQTFGVYPPLSNNNSATTLASPSGPSQPARQPMQRYWPQQSFGYGQMPFGFNPGAFGFPGFGGFNNFGFGFGGGFNNGFNNGFGNGFVAPGPVFPGYGSPYYQGYGAPDYRLNPRGKKAN